MHMVAWALALALDRAGRSIPANIAMMAITTSSSMRVKPRPRDNLRSHGGRFGRKVAFMLIRLKVRSDYLSLGAGSPRDQLLSPCTRISNLELTNKLGATASAN